MALWFLNKVVWFVLAAMLEGILLPSNMAAKTTLCLYLVKRLLVTLRCAVNVTTSSFQHFPWSLGAKFVSVQKEVIHNFKNSHFGHVTIYKLTYFKKMVRVLKPNHFYFVKIWPNNRFSKANSYNFHFHKNDVTWPLSANGLFQSRVDLAIVENILSPTLSLMLERFSLDCRKGLVLVLVLVLLRPLVG